MKIHQALMYLPLQVCFIYWVARGVITTAFLAVNGLGNKFETICNKTETKWKARLQLLFFLYTLISLRKSRSIFYYLSNRP